MNKKLIAFFSILSLSLSLSQAPANAVAKAGAKCAKAGITEVVKDKSYTCVKTGKKLVWNKGVKGVKVAPISLTRWAGVISIQAWIYKWTRWASRVLGKGGS